MQPISGSKEPIRSKLKMYRCEGAHGCQASFDDAKSAKELHVCIGRPAAAASLDEDIQAGETLIELQPGTHAFSGANVSGSLTIVGASAGDTTVECSGAFAVRGAGFA